VEVATSSSKYVRNGRKFKMNVWFYWFLGSFITDRSGQTDPKKTHKPDLTLQNSRTGKKNMSVLMKPSAIRL